MHDVVRLARRWLPVVGLLALGVFAVVRVVDLAWTCDDAFISYRYARHLIEGHGLVFNVGERVEGYTNFLFTMLVALAMRLGGEPRLSSMLLGAAAYFGVAALLARQAHAQRDTEGRFLPLGAALWLTQDDLHTWATGGLETTVFTFLAFAGVSRLVSVGTAVDAPTPRSRNASAVLGGVLLALACLTRPDGLLFALGGLVAYVLLLRAALSSRAERRLALASGAARAAAPLLVIVGAFVAFKLAYYGRLFPTAFYAKSATKPYYAQGLFYVALYGQKHWAFTVVLVGAPLAAAMTGGLSKLLARREALVALALGTLFTLYVAHSGGDYMFARRLVPALPFFFLFIDGAISALSPRIGLATALAVAVASFFPRQISLGDKASTRGIADERSFYPEAVIAARQSQAALARSVFGRHPVPAAFGGGMCMFAYYSELPYLVEPNGLTQYWIAERPLSQRGKKIGHEKTVPLDVLREHSIELVFHHDLPPFPPVLDFDQISVGDSLLAQMLVYDEGLMQTLARDPRVRFHRIDDVLREAATELAAMTCEDARASYEALFHYYLERHPDEGLPLRKVVREVCGR